MANEVGVVAGRDDDDEDEEALLLGAGDDEDGKPLAGIEKYCLAGWDEDDDTAEEAVNPGAGDDKHGICQFFGLTGASGENIRHSVCVASSASSRCILPGVCNSCLVSPRSILCGVCNSVPGLLRAQDVFSFDPVDHSKRLLRC